MKAFSKAKKELLDEEILVQLRDVDKEYIVKTDGFNKSARHTALSHVSLTLKKGEFVFLTGPSGAGKSSLIKIILGLSQPTSGAVYTLGQPVHEMSVHKKALLRRKIGIVFQNPHLLKNLNTFENVAISLTHLKEPAEKKKERVYQVLQSLELEHRVYAPVSTLSTGERQRVSLARALVHKPSLIIADEPTGNLDPRSSRSLIHMLREIRLLGSSVLIATHDMGLVKDFGGRVLELVAGNLGPENKGKGYQVPSFWEEKSL